MLPDQLQTLPPELSLPLPRFRQPISDPPLPAVTGDPGPATSDQPESPDHLPPTSPENGLPPRLDPSPEPRRRTRTFSAGDAETARRVLAGLIAIACTAAYGLFGRRGLHLRQPEERDVRGVTEPLSRIAARYLPMELIGPDLLDGTEAAAATHSYVMRGPLLTRIAEPLPEDLQ